MPNVEKVSSHVHSTFVKSGAPEVSIYMNSPGPLDTTPDWHSGMAEINEIYTHMYNILAMNLTQITAKHMAHRNWNRAKVLLC